MSGGYAVGDTVRNFIAYDLEGTSVDLYALLGGSKPVIVANGSVSCPRFRDIFNLDQQSGEYTTSREFILSHATDFEWVFIYGMEAHPTEGACPSNCPPSITTDTVVVQAATYAERLAAVNTWMNSSHIEFPFTMYADHPSNAIYNTYFERPSGWVAINCDGTVAHRGDWLMFSLLNPELQMELLEWGASHTACSIDWEPPVDPEEPIDAGPAVQFDGVADEATVHAGELLDLRLQLFPNPTTGEAWLTLPEPAQVVLVDARGQQVAEWNWPQGQHALALADLPAGPYLLLVSGQTSRTHRRLMKAD
jgi:hypothetical protein